MTMWLLMKPSCFPNPNAGLLWNVTADIELEESDDGSLHDLAVIHHLLNMEVEKHGKKLPTEPLQGKLLSDWMEKKYLCAEQVTACKLCANNIDS